MEIGGNPAINSPAARVGPREVASPFRGARVSRRARLLSPPGPTARAGTRLRSHRKRLFDLVLASSFTLALLPVLALIWCAVRLTSAGPGLYWSERVGQGGRLFWMPKFRTMRVDAPVMAREAMANADANVTPLGKLLRRTSIDEVPQLLCVLKGEMSMVGPRPLLPNDPALHVRRAFPDAMASVPGLSGLAQVSGRNGVGARRKARLDAFYARRGWWALDLQIVAQTILVVLTGKGFL